MENNLEELDNELDNRPTNEPTKEPNDLDGAETSIVPTGNLDGVESSATPNGNLDGAETSIVPTGNLDGAETSATPTDNLDGAEAPVTPTTESDEIKQIDEMINNYSNTIIRLGMLDPDKIEDYPRQIDIMHEYQNRVQDLIARKQSLISQQKK